MSSSALSTDCPALFTELSIEKMPAHWLLARLGKRVLRPGGLEMTRWLLDQATVVGEDRVVEFAPGLGVTATEILKRAPASYVGVERDATAAAFTRRALANAGYSSAEVVQGDANRVPLPSGEASLVIGEAMLSMQPHEKKLAIMAEAARLLKPGGRYAIHELAVTPNTLEPATLSLIHQDLSKHIHVGVRIGTSEQWVAWMNELGFEVERVHTAPMHLLEPARMVRDEGLFGTARFLFNVVRTPGALERLTRLRRMFHKHQNHLAAVALIARRPI